MLQLASTFAITARPDYHRLPSPVALGGTAVTSPSVGKQSFKAFKVMAEDYRDGKIIVTPTGPDDSVMRLNGPAIETIRNSPFGALVGQVTIVTDEDGDTFLSVVFTNSLRLRNRKIAYWAAWWRMCDEHMVTVNADRYGNYF